MASNREATIGGKKFLLVSTHADNATGGSKDEGEPTRNVAPLKKLTTKGKLALLSSTEAPKRALMARSLGYVGGRNEPAVMKARLPLSPQLVITNAGGLLGASGLVFGIQFPGLVDYATWKNVFAEFRFTKADLYFSPAGCNVLTGADNGFAAGIDYDSTIGTPGSLAFVMGLDDPQIIGMGETKPHHWHVNLEKFFGEVWNDTATSTSAICTWKAYSMGTGSASVSYGYWWGFVDVEFRGFH
jgi:hypothetical protein